jgi:hypothetical protein
MKIVKYEFNQYIIVGLNGEEYTLSMPLISDFISNDMTNNLTIVEEADYIYLYDLLKATI